MNDDTAVEDLRKGGQAGLTFIFNQYGKKLIHFFQRRYGLSHQDAEDVLQNTLLKLVRSIHSYDKQKSCLHTYLSKIGVNECIDWLNQQKHTPTGSSTGLGIIPSKQNLEQKLCYQLCVERMVTQFERDFKNAKECLHILTLKGEGGYIGDIANEIGRTDRATTEFLSQCRKKLKSYMQRCLDDCGQL
jgi:RNA polymerase sigma factor (sigma-70 family)